MASDTTVVHQSVSPPEPQPARRSHGWTALLVVSLLGILAAVVVPFSPVRANETVVTWPNAGEAPVSTTALFSPYQPAEVHVAVPCGVVRSAAGPQRKTVFTTDPSGTNRGVLVAVANNRVNVSIGGSPALDAPVTSGCDVRVDVTDNGSTVRIGDTVRTYDGNPVDEVFAFATDVPSESARGLEVRVRARIYSETAPSMLKLLVVGAWVILAGAALWMLARSRGVRPFAPAEQTSAEQTPAGDTPRRLRWLLDIGVLGVLLVWAVIGPSTWDDSYSAMTIRNSAFSGQIDNYYSQQNTSEMFTFSQWLLLPVVKATLAFPILRLPSVLLAIAVWLMISRVVLPSLLPRYAKQWPVQLTMAVVLLAWWMPYDQTLRFEPFAAFGTTAVLAMVLHGTSERARSLVWLGLAGLFTGFTAAVTPTGALVSATVWIVLAPRVWRTLADGRHWREADRGRVIARIAAVGALASSVLVITFLMQSWHGFSKATEQHNTGSMPNYGWFQDIVRYEYLLGVNDYSGTVTRRVPVLLAIALLLIVGLLLARGARGLPGCRDVPLTAALLIGGLFSLWLTPSKWSHHFGALAGFGAVFCAAALVMIVQAARHWVDDRRSRAAGVIGAALTIVAAAMAFSGTNSWVAWSQYGVPWQDGPVSPLNSPITWILLVGVAIALPRVFRKRAKVRAGAMLVAAPALVTVVAATASVLVLLFSFIVAPIRQASADGYSIGLQNVAHLTGTSCGLVDKVEMYPDVPDGVLRMQTGTPQLAGFTTAAGFASGPPAPPGEGIAKYTWGSLTGGPVSTGTLTTQWFSLPGGQAGQQVAVSVAGRTGDGNRLALEFGRSDRSGVSPLGERVLDDSALDKALRQSNYGSPTAQKPAVQDNPVWRALWVSRSDVPADANVVRVKAADNTTDPGGWIATTGPRLLQAIPMRQFLSAYQQNHGAVWVHPAMSLYMPCIRNFAPASHGMAAAPQLVINAGFPYGGRGPSFPQSAGGDHPFVGLASTTWVYEVPSRLTGGRDEPSQLDWGHVMMVNYPIARDRYSVSTTRVDRWGWQGDA